jgi:hypothetical protein
MERDERKTVSEWTHTQRSMEDERRGMKRRGDKLKKILPIYKCESS